MMNDEMEMMWMVVVMVWLKVLSQHLPGEENH